MDSFLKEIIKNIYPFNSLTKKQNDSLIKFSQVHQYLPQEFIYLENSRSDKVYILIKGRLVALSKQDGRYSEIELIKRGTIFGIISFFTEEPHSISIKAIEKSQVLEISSSALKILLNKSPRFTMALSQIFSQRIKKRFDQPKKIFQSIKLAVASFSKERGKTTYLFDLAKALNIQGDKKTIAVQFSNSTSFILPFADSQENILDISEFSEESIDRYINKGVFDWLCVSFNNESFDSVFPLINYLSENYHFVLFELPVLTHDKIEGLINYADYVHLLTSLDTYETGCINNVFSGINKNSLAKLKIISCDFLDKRIEGHFDFHIYATIPDINRTDYIKAIRRIAHELSGNTIGLVLGSGLAFGLAHIGVLEVFEENKIPIDIVSGSSIGALIASLWALGYSTKEIREIASDVVKKISFVSFSGFSIFFPFKGFLRAKKFENLLRGIFGNKTFYDLKHGLRIVAFDFIKREAVILKEGFLYKAIAASCSMPGVFEPVISKNDIYLDGGILNPLPVKSIIDYAKKIISVNVTPSKEEIISWYKHGRGVLNIFDFIFGSIETMQREFIMDSLKISDVSIHPDFEGLSWIEFNKINEFIKRGRVAAIDKLEDIKRLVKL